ncbi:MAG: phospholipid/glycerol acyltransferase [Subtercola sp.]|nr:phospholipid/glycerol acyltransferase [Subtercola sp.]
MGVPSRATVRLLVNPIVRGREYLSELPGPFLFVANHPSELDAPLLALVLARIAPRLVAVGAAPQTGARGAFESALGLRSAGRLAGLLNRGVSVLLFPESHRADDGTLTPFNLGAARLGILTGVPIVPVTLSGTYRALPPWRHLPETSRPRVNVIFGRPIRPAEGSEPSAVNDEIVTAITLGMAEVKNGWYGALRADAEGTPAAVGSATDEGGAERGTARWRRIWKATAPDEVQRRTVWVK